MTCDDCTGSYTGTWTANVQYASGNSASLVLKWSETLVPGPGGASAWDLTSASGTVTYTNVADSTDSCSTSLVPNPGFADGLGNSQGPQVVEGASIVVNPVPPTWWSSDPQTAPQALVSLPSTGNPNCDDTSGETAYEDGWSVSGQDCHADISAPLNATTTSPDNCDATYSDNFGNTGTGTLTSTLTISEGACTCSCTSGAPARDQQATLRVAAAAAGSPGGSGLSVRVGSGHRDHFETFTLKLSAYAGGGCKPYHFTWIRGPIPKPHVPGVAVTVKPKSAGPIIAQGSSALRIRLTCSISAALKRSLGIAKDNRFLSPCGIPFSYTVKVTDSGSPQKKGQDTVNLRWEPACLPAEMRGELKRERGEVERELWGELANTYGGAFSLDNVIEYVEAPELAPALFVKDVAEIGGAAAKAWAKAGQIDDELTEPNC